MKLLSMKLVCVLLATLVLVACKNEAVLLTLAYESNQCGNLMQGITLIQDQGQLDAAIQPSSGFREAMPEIDFNQQMAVLIALGFKSSSAWGLELIGEEGHFAEGILTLPVKEQVPKPGMMYAQVMTSPCLLLTLDRLEGIQSVRRVDPEQ